MPSDTDLLDVRITDVENKLCGHIEEIEQVLKQNEDLKQKMLKLENRLLTIELKFRSHTVG
jgi:hypothetical protein